MAKKLMMPDKSKLGRLIEEGFELIPLHHAHAVGKNNKKIGKRPLNARWTTMDLEKPIKLLHMMDEGHNLGVRLHETPEYLILVIDIDPRNFPLEGETDNQGNILPTRPDLALEKKFGFSMSNYPTVLTGSWFPAKDPSTGMHVYMKAKKPDGWSDGDKLAMHMPGFKGIDFKSVGGQVVAPGSVHPDFNRYYEWDDVTCPPIEEIGWAPEALVEALYKPHGQAGSQHWEGEPDMTPEMLQQLLDQLVVEEFREHEKWLQMMMACHAATNGQGLNEFVAWSTGDPQFAHVGSDIAYRWETLNPNKSGGITYATLKKIAKDHGVEQMPLSPEEFADLDDDELLDVSHLPDKKHPLRELNDAYFTALDAGQFRVFTRVWDTELETHVLVRMTQQDFVNALAHLPKIQQGKKVVPMAKAWLEWPGRNHYDSINYMPEYGDEKTIDKNGQRIYNLWDGFSVTDRQQGDWSLLDELIRTVLANDDDKNYEYILNWLAWSVQNPHKPAEVALVFQGGKGTGKGTLGRFFVELFGPHGMHITSTTLLTGRFNSHLRQVSALFADEAFYAATGSHHSAEQMLKGLITEPRIAFEGKGTNAIMGRNCLHIVMASNSDWIAPMSNDGERRFAVFLVSDARKQDGEFFGRLHQQMRDGGLEGFLWVLRNRDVSAWHPRMDIPKTEAYIKQLEYGQTNLEGFLYSAIYDGEADLWDPYENDWESGMDVRVLCSDFEAAFRSWMKQFPGNRMYKDEASTRAIGRQLKTIFGSRIQRIKLSKPPEGRLSSSRPYAYVFPPLDECREHWTRRSNTPIDWPAD